MHISGAKLVGIEHIVVATIFEMCYKRLKKNLNEFNNIPCVKIFIEGEWPTRDVYITNILKNFHLFENMALFQYVMLICRCEVP